MKVFISWSGQLSREIAMCLRDILPLALMRIKFWMSETDIAPGSQWSQEVRRNLSESTVGIICLTPENLDSSWIYYESGALSHAVGNNLVIPYLHDIPAKNLTGPLSLFHSVQADEEGTRKLFQAINNAAAGEDRLSERELELSFTNWWSHIKSRLENIKPEKKEIRRSDRELLEEVLEMVKQNSNQTGSETQQMMTDMLHQLAILLVGVGLLSQEVKDILLDTKTLNPKGSEVSKFFAQHEDLLLLSDNISTQSKFGMYIIRNYLPYLGKPTRDKNLTAQFEKVDIGYVLDEMVKLHLPFMREQGITMQMDEIKKLPVISGNRMEINRLFYNLLNNAIQYSRTTAQSSKQRVIRITSKIPYDPGFKNLSFAITFENYGLGIEKDEVKEVFKPGFRGKQAVSEIAIGAGIGLSEALKIMRLHKGEIKVDSRKLPGNEETYLTRLTLIFPLERILKE